MNKLLIYCLVVFSGVIAGCATIISSSCPLEDFEGTFVGRYNVGGIIPIPIEDTIVITVDIDLNQAFVSSVLLDTTFVTDYSSEKNELKIGGLSVPLFVFGSNEFYDVSVVDGFSNLDGSCDKLYIQMNKLSVLDHNLVGIPKPITNLDLTTPNFMRRIN